MQIFLKRKKRQHFAVRQAMSDHDFLSAIQMSGTYAESFTAYCRLELGNIFKIDPLKIYPADKWRDLYCLVQRDWDMFEIVDSLEKGIGIEITDNQVPSPTWNGSKTIGLWISEFIKNCLPED
jgi:hypothetical protein